MKKQIAVLLSLIFSLSIVSMAQTKTVTNADLEKFRQERLKAEREYRENYERLGFPSPEELERQREEDRVKRENLSERLRNERLQREAIQAQNERNQAIQRQNQYLQNVATQTYSSGGYYYGGYGFTPYVGGYGGYGFYNTHRYRQPNYYNPNAFPNGRFVPIAKPYLPLSIRNTFPFRNPNFHPRYNNPNIRINIGGGKR